MKDNCLLDMSVNEFFGVLEDLPLERQEEFWRNTKPKKEEVNENPSIPENR